MHTSNLSTQEVETVVSQIQGHPKAWATQDPVFKKIIITQPDLQS